MAIRSLILVVVLAFTVLCSFHSLWVGYVALCLGGIYAGQARDDGQHWGCGQALAWHCVWEIVAARCYFEGSFSVSFLTLAPSFLSARFTIIKKIKKRS